MGIQTSSLEFYTLDVFTDRRFGGNPLAVFTHADGLSDDQMQRIAAEMNLSETIFITEQTAENTWAVRIFMPKGEIPFAGHPTVGASLLLKHLGWIGMDQTLTLEERAGSVPVNFIPSSECNDVTHSALPVESFVARFTAPQLPSVRDSELNMKNAANLLSLKESDFECEPFIGSGGVPYQLIELTSLSSLKTAELQLSVWGKELGDSSIPDVCIFVKNDAERRLDMRVFAPAAGIAEDPATGSAAAALVGGLAIKEKAEESHDWTIYQGAEMGRPSTIHAHVEMDRSQVSAVNISGTAVLISKGEMYI